MEERRFAIMYAYLCDFESVPTEKLCYCSGNLVLWCAVSIVIVISERAV